MRPNIVSEAGLQTRAGQWWDSIPFLTSAVVIVCGVIYLICLLVGYDTFYEICFLPEAIGSHFQVYRIYTSIIFHGSLLHVLFNMLALVPLGSELERIMGSIRLLYMIILLATSNAIFHLIIASVVAHNPFHPYDPLMNECAIGFSGILFSMIVIETSLSGVQSRRSKMHTYDDVVERVACKVGVDDPSKIRLTSHNCHSQQPKPQSIKYRGVEHLSEMLVHYNQTSDILYYEVLDIPLPELQGLKNLKVAFYHATKDEVVIHNIRLPKQSTVGDVLDELKKKVELSHPTAELRLLEVFHHKIFKIFPPSEKIENINDQYWTLRAEEIPEEEENLGPQDRLIHVYHFIKETGPNQMQVQNFGEPFFLVIHEGETLVDVKVRIQAKLQVPDEEFSKWKFALLSLGRPEYLEDSDILFNRFQRRDVYGAWEQYLGLEHSDNSPKRAYVNQNRHAFEKPVKIYN